MKITLIGGHGKVALLTLPFIAGDAVSEVDAVIRNPGQSEEVRATGASPVVADLQTLDADGWDRLFEGRDAVIWSAGAGGGSPERTWAIDRDAAIASIDAAVRQGVRRYVMVSYFGAGPDHGVPEDSDFYAYAESKTEADAHLERSGLGWTLVRPSALTDDEATGAIDVHAGKGTSVSRGNVAAVVASVVGRSDLNGKTISFNDGSTHISDALDEIAEGS